MRCSTLLPGPSVSPLASGRRFSACYHPVTTELQSRTVTEDIAYVERRTLKTRAVPDATYPKIAAMRNMPTWHPAGGFWPPFAFGAGVFVAGMIVGRLLLP